MHEEVEQIKFRKCLLPFGPKCFVFSFIVYEYKNKIHRTIILPATVCWCKISCFTLREGHILRVFDNNRVLKISQPKTYKGTGDWRILHNEKLHDLCSSPNIIWLIKYLRGEWGGHMAHIGKKRSILAGKSNRNTPFAVERKY